MSDITMFDDIYVSSLPLGAAAYAGYVGGSWPTFPELQAKFPKAFLLSIAVNSGEDAECLDVESGDATIAEVYAWFIRQQARKVWKPVVYTSVDNVNSLVATMTANGFARNTYRIWSAHYDKGAHICGPATCADTDYACDGTQWTSTALGRSLDESLLNPDFFGGTVATGPYRHVVPAGNKLSITGLAATRNMTEDEFLAEQQQFVNEGHLSTLHYEVLQDSLRSGDTNARANLSRPALVPGTVYYTKGL